MRVSILPDHGVHLERRRPGGGRADARPSSPRTGSRVRAIRPIQVSTPAMDGPGVFYHLANYLRTVSHGQPIGLLGFSAGGALAMRLAGQPGLNVTAVMNYYGPPDLEDWIAHHGDDFYYRYVASHVHLTSGIVDLLSGPSTSDAYFVNAFGLRDRNVVSSVSTASFHKDFQHGQVYTYHGPSWCDDLCRLSRIPGLPGSPLSRGHVPLGPRRCRRSGHPEQRQRLDQTLIHAPPHRDRHHDPGQATNRVNVLFSRSFMFPRDGRAH